MTKSSLTRGLIGLGGLILIWQLTVSLGLMKESVLPGPVEVAETLYDQAKDGILWSNLEASMIRVAGGFAIAAVVGIATAVVMGLWRPVAEILMPIIDVLRPISPIAWIPLAILWFGLGNGPAWFVIFIASFFPVVTSTFKGVTSVQLNQKRAAACLGIRGLSLIRMVILPSAIPDIATGLRTGLGIGWMAVIAAEFVSAQSGLGYQIQVSQQVFATERVVAGMVVIGALGFLMNASMLWAERRIAPWVVYSRETA